MTKQDEKQQQTQPNFETFGNDDASAVCGPEGCNIEQHRQAADK
ncbi:hypothetical protein [Lactiplantibacillus modestisalitolerans]|uniref:Uncharacterized protein n=1 Tax=Lactiplantibacillus modestisalitolerans TaxID=1457219 RepID=A0ABV5WRF3_9LACO|nr:hypothetical protein [Lactiplantibacillus modestisalitolerans]